MGSDDNDFDLTWLIAIIYIIWLLGGLCLLGGL